MEKYHIVDYYLEDTGEVGVHRPFGKLWCHTVVHFDLGNTSNSTLKAQTLLFFFFLNNYENVLSTLNQNVKSNIKKCCE